MDAGECVVSAGRAVLDMVEREWQPLSSAELEQRLDQAVEEILEADLMAKVKAQPPPAVYLRLPQIRANAQPRVSRFGLPEEETPQPRDEQRAEERAAVKHIADLLQSSESGTRMAGRAPLSLSHTVLLSLALLAERVSYRSVSQRFCLEKGNIHRIFFSFCERVNALEETLIRWPVGSEALEALVPLCSPQQEQRRVPQVLGVLGHTRIPVRMPMGKLDKASPAPPKRMKEDVHPDSWLNLELLCDRQGRFLHCRVSKGSDVDRGGALRDKLHQHPQLMPPDSYIVAGPGYPLTARILTPFSGGLGPREELFNRTLQEHFRVLDRAVASLRARFHRLRYLDIGNYDRARAVVLTACVLHNVFLDMGQAVQGQVERGEAISDEGEGEEEEEGVRRRDAVSELLFKSHDSGNT